MNVGTVVFLITLLVVVAGAAVLVARRPRRGPGLEPPAPPVTQEQPPSADAPPIDVTDDITVEAPPELDDATVAEIEEALAEAPPAAPAVKPSFRDRLAKARGVFSGYVGSVLSRSKIDQDTWDDLEEALLRADVGVGPTTELLDAVRVRVKEESISEPSVLLDALKQEMKARLVGDRELHLDPDSGTNVWLFVGVNG